MAKLQEASGWRNCLPAHKINTAINPHHGTRSHIPNQAIILDWQVSRRASTRGCRTRLSRHVVQPAPIDQEKGDTEKDWEKLVANRTNSCSDQG